jgi:hypothetical protein
MYETALESQLKIRKGRPITRGLGVTGKKNRITLIRVNNPNNPE